MNLFIKINVLCLLSLALTNCSDRYKIVHEQLMLVDKDNLKDDTLIQDPTTGTYFSRLTKPNSFGRSFTYRLSKNQLGKEFYVVFYGKSRSNYAQSNATISMVATTKEKEQLCWISLFLKRHYTDINKWCYFRDSLRIEPNYHGKICAEFASVVYLSGSSAEIFDMDTLHVVVKEKI